MKTLLVKGSLPLPADLLDLVQRGSTALDERRVAELDASSLPAGVDRILLWNVNGDPQVADLARAYWNCASADRKNRLLVISSDAASAISGLPASEVLVWPRDEDRLRMAFMTGA